MIVMADALGKRCDEAVIETGRLGDRQISDAKRRKKRDSWGGLKEGHKLKQKSKDAVQCRWLHITGR